MNLKPEIDLKYTEEQLVAWQVEGFDLLRQQKKTAQACDSWWKLWVALKWQLPKEVTCIGGAASVYPGLRPLFDWALDFQDALHNAALGDSKYAQIAVQFFSEYVDRFPDDEQAMLASFRSELAFSHALLGELPLAIGLMEKFIKDHPDKSVGYCTLVDILTFCCKRVGLKPDYQRALAVVEVGKRSATDQENWGFDDVEQSLKAEAKTAGYAAPGTA